MTNEEIRDALWGKNVRQKIFVNNRLLATFAAAHVNPVWILGWAHLYEKDEADIVINKATAEKLATDHYVITSFRDNPWPEGHTCEIETEIL